MHTASLRCHHQRRFKNHPPEVGDVIWCPVCQDYRTVSLVFGPHRAQCTQCPRLNAAGQDENRVLKMAHEHAEHYNHTVIQWESGKAASRKVITADSSGQTLLPIQEM